MKDIIFSSKLYKNNKYKETIKSAIDSPMNTELVQQLKDYVEDDYEKETKDEFGVSFSDLGDSENDVVDFNDFADEPLDFDDESEEIYDDKLSDVVEIEEEFDINDIKDDLNENEESSGVVRISDSDGELWIHYNDKINLNNVMESVIDVMSKNYDSYEFNRLARTENAIVFTHEEEVTDESDAINSIGGDMFGKEEEN